MRLVAAAIGSAVPTLQSRHGPAVRDKHPEGQPGVERSDTPEPRPTTIRTLKAVQETHTAPPEPRQRDIVPPKDKLTLSLARRDMHELDDRPPAPPTIRKPLKSRLLRPAEPDKLHPMTNRPRLRLSPVALSQ